MLAPQSILAAFSAGLISFFAPCLVPLFPSYFSTITGFTFSELYGLDFSRIRRRVFISSIFFTLGFTLIFTLLGATGSIVGQLFNQYFNIFLRLSGLFLIFLGFIQIGVWKTDAFQYDFAWKIQKRLSHMGYLTALVTGVSSALSWIPCIGPLLSPILLMAGEGKTVAWGASLLFIFSLGLTLPFLLAGLFFPAIACNLQQQRQLFHRMSVAAGVFLIFFGIILVLDQYRPALTIFNLIVESLKTPLSGFFLKSPNY
ncbi:sulfite exporter TauE/SafE family protein [Candidatus Woesebacteria bacterium]|nr:sulfite exporter TauE/SafE family protein [Candidatus Woesebacteria bacterium]